MVWDGVEARAVVACDRLRRSRDVTMPTPVDMASAPFPLGLGISLCAGTGERKTPLPLYYVSEQVARDRSPYSNSRNASGVVTGWYVILEAGMRFEVVMTKVNGEMPVEEEENQFSCRLFVDGDYTHQKVVFGGTKGVGIQLRSKGFVLRREMGEGGKKVKVVRVFEVGKVGVGREEDEEGNLEVGSVRGEFSMQKRGEKEEEMITGKYLYESEGGVSEREIVKYGRSLKVRKDADKAMICSRQSGFEVEEARVVPEAEVCVFIRELGWMKSRRLVDESGSPCAYDMYVAMIEQEHRLEEMRRNGHVSEQSDAARDQIGQGRVAGNSQRNLRGWLDAARPLQLRGSRRKEGAATKRTSG